MRKRKPKLGTGKRFKALSRKIASQYRKKGMSSKKALRIAKATAAKIGRKKLGKKKFQKLAVKGRKRKRRG